ncbi:putative necrosis-inducing factor domain containing protein [Naviculisporaceae sp. PSN 640]
MAPTGLGTMLIHLAVLALLSALVQAWGGLQYCGASTFENRGSDASPWIEDCEALMFRLQEDINKPDAWTIGTCQQRGLVSLDSCTLGMEQAMPHPTCMWGHDPTVATVGYGDLVYILNESISRFGIDGRVGAKGFITCSPEAETTENANMMWGIY